MMSASREAFRFRWAALFCLAAAPAFTGCGGSKSQSVWMGDIFVPAPWDEKLVPVEDPRRNAEWAQWAEGVVSSVSEDGSTVTVSVRRGVVHEGETASIYHRPFGDFAAPHYLHDEARELLVARGAVVSEGREAFTVRLVPPADAREPTETELHTEDRAVHAPVEPGDAVVVRRP
jgi:hypothetical protein